MSQAERLKAARKQEEGATLAELDEDFLRLVDRAMQLRKQHDPYKLDQTARALDQEVRLAHLNGTYDFDPERKRSR